MEKITRDEEEKGYVELINPINNKTLRLKEGVSNDYQENSKHVEKGDFNYFLFHFMRFICLSSAYHTPSQPAFAAFESKDFN